MGFDTTLFPKLDFRDEARFWEMVQSLQRLFHSERASLERVIELGVELKDWFFQMEPMLQGLCREICPYCGSVCCANRHGFPEYADIICFLAMGEDVPSYDLSVDEGALCQFLGQNGCVLPRTRRPYRCTWYFCEPMLVEVDLWPIKRYREFLESVKGLAQKRGELLKTFYELYGKGL